MATRAKVAISLDGRTLSRLDRLVKSNVFPNRSQAIQAAVDEKLARLDKSRLAQECAKANPAHEKALAEEGMSWELIEWPEY
jgi:metal-responsive CopG/Arc/MetJ family transcriptional regulator